MAMGLLNMIPQLPSFTNAGMNFAIGNMNRQRQTSQIRHLRRREYQDMVFSMKQAGLNPILAVGATPGHSAGGTQMGTGTSGSAGVGSAVAANRQAGVGEGNLQINKVKAPYEVANLTMNKHLLAAQIEGQSLNNRFTAASTTKATMEARKALEEGTSQAFHRLLAMKRAEREGWTSKALERELEGKIGGNIYQDPVGYIGNIINGQQSENPGSLKSLGGTIMNKVGTSAGEAAR